MCGAVQLEEAVELFMFAGRPRQALRILDQRLSDAIEGAVVDAGRADEADTLIARGNAAVAAMGSTQDAGTRRHGRRGLRLAAPAQLGMDAPQCRAGAASQCWAATHPTPPSPCVHTPRPLRLRMQRTCGKWRHLICLRVSGRCWRLRPGAWARDGSRQPQ